MFWPGQNSEQYQILGIVLWTPNESLAKSPKESHRADRLKSCSKFKILNICDFSVFLVPQLNRLTYKPGWTLKMFAKEQPTRCNNNIDTFEQLNMFKFALKSFFPLSKILSWTLRFICGQTSWKSHKTLFRDVQGTSLMNKISFERNFCDQNWRSYGPVTAARAGCAAAPGPGGSLGGTPILSEKSRYRDTKSVIFGFGVH